MESRTRTLLRREDMEVTAYTITHLLGATNQTEGKSSRPIAWYRGNTNRFPDPLAMGRRLPCPNRGFDW